MAPSGMKPKLLEGLVEQNRLTISVIFPLAGALLFLASYEALLPDFLSYNPLMILVGTLVMRLPLISGLTPLIDRRFLAGLGSLTVYSYLIEFIGVKTGLPYGNFSYGIELGPMIAGKVPLGLPLFFIPLVINSYILSILLFPEKTENPFYLFSLPLGTVILLDLILDPAAVAINFWSYSGGVFYGVPITNYLGWVLSAGVAVTIITVSLNNSKLRKRVENCNFILDDMVSFVLLWGIVNLYFLNLLPVLLTVLLIVLLVKSGRFDFAGI